MFLFFPIVLRNGLMLLFMSGFNCQAVLLELGAVPPEPSPEEAQNDEAGVEPSIQEEDNEEADASKPEVEQEEPAATPTPSLNAAEQDVDMESGGPSVRRSSRARKPVKKLQPAPEVDEKPKKAKGKGKTAGRGKGKRARKPKIPEFLWEDDEEMGGWKLKYAIGKDHEPLVRRLVVVYLDLVRTRDERIVSDNPCQLFLLCYLCCLGPRAREAKEGTAIKSSTSAQKQAC